MKIIIDFIKQIVNIIVYVIRLFLIIKHFPKFLRWIFFGLKRKLLNIYAIISPWFSLFISLVFLFLFYPKNAVLFLLTFYILFYLSTNVLNASLSLLLFYILVGTFIFLNGCDYLGLFIITVYAGALAVLLVFVMMLVDLTNKTTPSFYSVVNSYIPYIISHLLFSLISPSVFRTISLYRRYLYISFFFLIFFFLNLEILYDKESIPSDIIHLSFFCRLIFEQVCISAYPYLRDCYFYVSSIDQSHYDFSYITELSDSSAISILDKVNLSTNLESIGDALYVYHSVNLLVLGLVLFTAIIGTLYLVLDINCHPLSQNLSKQISKGSKTIRILRN